MRQLRWLLLFFPLLFAGDRLGAWVLQRQVESSLFRYSDLYLRPAEADVLLLGNSRGLIYYQPHIEQITGLKSANLSYNGLSADIAAALVLDHLDHCPQTKLLLIDITLLDRENDELLSGFASYSMYSPRLDALIQERLPKIWWGTQISHLFRYNNEVFQRALYYRKRDDKDWLIDRVISDRLIAEKDKHPFEFKENAYLLDQLVRMVEAAKQKHVAVRLLIGPYFPGFKPGGLDELKKRVELATKMPVGDYRDALQDSSDFGDLMHPNKKGSMAYIDLLARDGILKMPN